MAKHKHIRWYSKFDWPIIQTSFIREAPGKLYK